MLLLFLVSIVIANLIIGLSVTNIEELLKESEVYKMEKMVQQISAAEIWKTGLGTASAGNTLCPNPAEAVRTSAFLWSSYVAVM